MKPILLQLLVLITSTQAFPFLQELGKTKSYLVQLDRFSNHHGAHTLLNNPDGFTIDWGAVSKSIASFSKNPRSSFKYILYDVKVGEGFNLQKEVFFRVALLVLRLNDYAATACGQGNQALCKLFVLVLPPWCRLAHWSLHSGFEPLPWGNLFDFNVIRSKLPVLEYEDFLKYHGDNHKIDLGVYFKFDMESSRGTFKEADSIKDCGELAARSYKQVCQPETSSCSFPFEILYSGSCGILPAKNLTCYSVAFLSGPTAADVIWDRLKKNSSFDRILLKNCDSMLVPWPLELYNHQLIDALFPSQAVQKVGNAFKDEHLGDNYIAAHVRLSDFAYYNRSPPLRYVAQRMMKLMDMHNTVKGFVCTDGTPEERKEMQSYMIAPKKLLFLQSDLGHPGLNAITEQWIATLSVYFIGTAGSRYSSAIRWERLFHGMSFAMSGDTFCKDATNTDQVCLSTESHDPPEGLSESWWRTKGK